MNHFALKDQASAIKTQQYRRTKVLLLAEGDIQLPQKAVSGGLLPREEI